MKSIIAFLMALLISLASGDKPKQPAQVMDAGNVVINVYGKPEAIPLLSTSAFTDAFNQLRERLKTMTASMPAMPTLPPMPAMPTMPTFAMPTYPSQIRVPVRIEVEGQEYKFPTPPPMPTLPPMKIPEKLVVHRVEMQTPNLSMPASMPAIRPIQVEYQDFKPSGPMFKPGTLLLQPVKLEPVVVAQTAPAPAPDKKHKKKKN